MGGRGPYLGGDASVYESGEDEEGGSTSIFMPSRSFIGVPPPVPSSFVAEVMETLDLRGGIRNYVEYAYSV